MNLMKYKERLFSVLDVPRVNILKKMKSLEWTGAREASEKLGLK
jgi:hypothetical protein